MTFLNSFLTGFASGGDCNKYKDMCSEALSKNPLGFIAGATIASIFCPKLSSSTNNSHKNSTCCSKNNQNNNNNNTIFSSLFNINIASAVAEPAKNSKDNNITLCA